MTASHVLEHQGLKEVILWSVQHYETCLLEVWAMCLPQVGSRKVVNKLMDAPLPKVLTCQDGALVDLIPGDNVVSGHLGVRVPVVEHHPGRHPGERSDINQLFWPQNCQQSSQESIVLTRETIEKLALISNLCGLSNPYSITDNIEVTERLSSRIIVNA